MWFGLLHQLGTNQAESMVKNIRALQSIRDGAAVKVGVLSPIRSFPILQLWAEREEGLLGYILKLNKWTEWVFEGYHSRACKKSLRRKKNQLQDVSLASVNVTSKSAPLWHFSFRRTNRTSAPVFLQHLTDVKSCKVTSTWHTWKQHLK